MTGLNFPQRHKKEEKFQNEKKGEEDHGSKVCEEAIDGSTEGGLTQLWKLFTVIPCAPKNLKS